jgi:hypothetical protein
MEEDLAARFRKLPAFAQQVWRALREHSDSVGSVEEDVITLAAWSHVQVEQAIEALFLLQRGKFFTKFQFDSPNHVENDDHFAITLYPWTAS